MIKKGTIIGTSLGILWGKYRELVRQEELHDEEAGDDISDVFDDFDMETGNFDVERVLFQGEAPQD